MSEFIEGSPDVYFHKGSEIAFTSQVSRKAEPTRLVNKAQDNFLGEFIPWGDDNLHPQFIAQQVESNDILSAVIGFKVKALTSGGMQYGHIYHENGQDVYEPIHVPEVDDFLEDNEIDNFLDESARDHYTHANMFPEIILNVGRKAVGLHNNDAVFSRLGAQIKEGRNKGKIDKVYVHADWSESLTVKDAVRIDAVDPYYKVAEQIKQGRAFKYTIPTRAQSAGRLDYNKGTVDSLIASGWLGIDSSIPIWIEKIMNNQLNIRYSVEVDANYWSDRWKDWHSFPEKKQGDLKRKTYQKFIDFFKGVDSAGNVLFTSFKGVHDKDGFSTWRIKKIEGEKWDSGHIEQSTQSSAHIITSQGVDSTLIPLIPGKGFQAGSGSDKRVAFNQHVLLCQPDQRRILRPFDYIADINGWNERYGKDGSRLKFWFKNTFIATLDHGKDTKPANDNNTKKT